MGGGEVVAPHPGRIRGGHRGVVASAALRGQRDAARLDLAEAHPQRAVDDRAVGIAEAPRLGQRPKRRLPQQHIGAVPARRALDRVDHGDAARGHPPVQLVDVEHPRGEVVDVRGAHARDVGGDRGDRGQFLVPAAVDRLARQRERRDRVGDELPRRARVAHRRPAAMRRASAISAGSNSLALGQEPLDAAHAGRRRRSGCRRWPASR